MLLELHHWTYPQLNETDTDDLMGYIVYYPKWREMHTGDKAGQREPRRTEVFADQVQF